MISIVGNARREMSYESYLMEFGSRVECDQTE